MCSRRFGMPGVWTNLIVGPLCVGWGKEGVGVGVGGGGDGRRRRRRTPGGER